MARLGDIGAGILSGGGKLLRRTIDPYAGKEPQGNTEYETINPREQYWRGVGRDVTSVMLGQAPQNMGHRMADAADIYNREGPQRLADRKYKEDIARAQLLNAQRPPTPAKPSAFEAKLLAMGLTPGTPEYQAAAKELAAKSGQTINMGNDFRQGIAGNIMDVRTEAVEASNRLASYDAMEEILPYLGKTGVGKESMTSFRSFMNQFGMGSAAGALDAVMETAGIDLLSGDQGAQELFRALSNEEVVEKARLLAPVSDSDRSFLREMAATLATGDPEAAKVLIERGRRKQRGVIDKYNWMRGQLPEGVPLPPEVGVDPLDTSGVTGKQVRSWNEAPE
jgi:hypothetical protein